jgi:RNA recognition motif-containing protein
MEKLISTCKDEHSSIKDYEVLVVNSMEMLSDDEDEERRDEPDEEEFDDRDVRNAMRNKRDFEIFIGSLPTNADERELADLFKQKRVKITNIRILRSTFFFI